MSNNNFWGEDDFQRESDEYFAFTQVTKNAKLYPENNKKNTRKGHTFWWCLGVVCVIQAVVWLFTEGVTWFISLFQ